MIVTFTGTRLGTTPVQLMTAFNLINADLPDRFLHGGAPGADTEIDGYVAPVYWQRGSGEERLLTRLLGLVFPIQVFPVDSKRQAYWLHNVDYTAIREVYEPQDPLRRNKIMARLCDQLIACPAEQNGEVLRSGTWATVRYARELCKHITIIRPDGKIEVEDRNGRI